MLSFPSIRPFHAYAYLFLFCRYLYGQLVKNPVVTETNKDHIVEVLRSIAELMIWGDQHNENFFEYVLLLFFFVSRVSQR